MTGQDTCRIVRGNGSYEGRQGLTYFAGISAESVGARGICMHLLRDASRSTGQGAPARGP